MVVVSENQHARSLHFAQQRKVVILRDTQHLSWPEIADRVPNRLGERPSEWLVAEIYKNFNRRLGRVNYQYKKCGRKAWKVTEDVRKFIVERLLALRKDNICTSTMLQRELVRAKHIELEVSTIRKILKKAGYKWKPRAQKRKYSPEVIAQRLAFCRAVLRMTIRELRIRLSLALDGVVLGMPPKDETERANYCRYGDTHMWRKDSEAASPELAGDDPYGKQIPIGRSIPLWGGISEGGFAPVVFHLLTKKLDEDKWVAEVRGGKLVAAIKKINPISKSGPWHVLCDNESFLRTKESMKAYKANKIKLWGIPAKSPDLNPVEKFWGWVRKQMRAHDFADLRAKRPVPGKMAYTMRVKRLLKSQKAQRVAGNIAKGLRKVCHEVVHKKKGSASRG